MSSPPSSSEPTFDDLAQTLSKSYAERDRIGNARPPARKREDGLIQPWDTSGPWEPPPSMDDVRDMVQFVKVKFNNYTTVGRGQAFSGDKFLKPKVLNTWQLSRCIQPPRNYEKFIVNADGEKFKPYRYRAQPSPIPYSSTAGMGDQHRKWLEAHMKRRERDLYPVYYTMMAKQRREEALDPFKIAAKRKRLEMGLIEEKQNLAGGPAKEEAFVNPYKDAIKAGRVKHTEVWRNSDEIPRYLGMQYPWQEVGEANECKKNYIPDARKRYFAARRARMAAIVAKKEKAAEFAANNKPRKTVVKRGGFGEMGDMGDLGEAVTVDI